MLIQALIAAVLWTGTANFSADLLGVEDTRPATWGLTAVSDKRITFRPPAGSRVRILRLQGDLVARVIGGHMPADKVGVMAAANTERRPQGSTRADWLADGGLLYAQGDIGADGVVRVPFDVEFPAEVANAVLGPEHRLWVTMATYLNETYLPVHMEITFSQILYTFEPQVELGH